ncbi:phage tail tape measure protein [Sphingomonas sp. S2-65]|uniref:phage tail tape measure protein n=1 Tax=Sphingomonas sp. S2-65 TaxID=2903960 RepID=UPI001F388CD1|nr:phage tail tape measure protein [Sphingomonas sp. S2-65]UYY60103.1 phage tail tape measure protein [Sphingomonas sp. S2-65]
MSGNAVIGALRGVLVLDTGDWTPAVNRARGDLSGLRTVFEQLSRTLDDVSAKARGMGTALTVGVTAPLAALAVTSNRSASGFEASMKRVEAALKGVSGRELKTLSDQAKTLGPAVGKGATEAADGIEALGLAGVSTADIMGGALKASLDLAAAGAAEVPSAVSLVTDVMGQFKATAGELPTVVNDVVGALDASKFGFLDFQGAVAQGGGVAASAGLSFRDFATAIAATSTQFSSGSDAGTSFKTYIQSLVPVSKEAEFAMKKLGIEFFDMRTGRMKPLAEQAEVLRKAFAGLSDKSKTDALKTIFGSDAARTAIGLMEKGRQGIADLQQEIAGGDVGGKIAKRLEGEAAATTRMANAFESVKIAIGEAGLTAMITSVKNSFASFMEGIANANPALLRVGVVIGAIAAALGPLAVAFGALAAFLIAKVARGFGAIGWAISLVLEPISTLGAALAQLVARVGLGEALAMLSRSFLGIVGPIGWAVAGVILFKDSIIAALGQVWKYAQENLGPPLTALFQQLGTVASQVANGPMGAAFGFIVTAIKGVVDVAGTFIGAMVQMFGVALVQALQLGVRAISGFVDVVSNIVGIVTALLTGDFAGAWGSAGAAVDAACQTIIDIVTMVFPQLVIPIQVAYEAAKSFLVDGFTWIMNAFTGVVASGVNWVAGAFPNVVSAAKGVYDGVKGWLVDKFGGLMTWIGNAAKWIGDKYAALKQRLGLGGSGEADASPLPAAPKSGAPIAPPVSGTRNVDFTAPKKERASRKGRGRDTKYDGDNREQLRVQAELEAARARGDKEAERRIQDQLALSKQVEAYQRTGLTLDQARVAAQRDMHAIQAARSEAIAKEVADERAAVAIEVARIGNDRALEATLERQAELKRRVATYYEQTKNLAEATRLAEADQAAVDAARADVRRRWFADDAQDRALRLAQERGDSEERLRQLQREIDIRERARRLQDEGMSAPAAFAQAASEAGESERARITGLWRSTLKDGLRSALDGNIGDWVKNWWKDKVAKGMEDALNSLADLIANLFSKAGNGGGSGSGGGILSSIGKALGGLFGKSKGAGDWTSGVTGGPIDVDIPGFRTGGSFKVGGMSGVDANLVQFRASKGEIVDIRRPGNDNRSEGRSLVVNMSGVMTVEDFWARIQALDAQAAAGGAAMARSQSARAAGRRLGRP